MRKPILCILPLVTFLLAGAVNVEAESPEFKQMKKLIGSWKGQMKMENGQDAPCNTSYELTAGGSAILEKCFAGTPMEMITVYTDDADGVLQMTHYCMLGNQPKLKLVKADGKKLSFDLAADAKIDVTNETHMHSAVFDFESADKMVQQWVKFENGQASAPMPMVLNRVK